MRSHRVVAITLAAAVLGLFAVAPAANAKSDNELVPKHVLKSFANGVGDQGDQGANGGARSKSKPGTSNGISYHGGPVILGTTNAYVIWYGNWSGNSATTILTDLLSNIGGSPYYGINTTYYDGSNTHVSNSVHYAGSTTMDTSVFGTSLSDSKVQQIVSSAISSGSLANDTNGLYFVLTSAGIAETSGFLTQYCGWHTHGSIAGSDIKYSFVGDPSANLSACSVQSTSPNGNAAADAMASVIAHELEETATDPDLNAWYDSRGYENADKCAWTFGTTLTAANGSAYNMTLGTRQFLIQRNWVNASGGLCALKYP